MSTPTPFTAVLERIQHLPTEPGCYLMKDHRGKIFYIGKAINLRNRVKSYFTGQDTREFVSWLSHLLADIETIVVRNNIEALVLEQTLIRKHKPKFNILLKDDKNFILLRLAKPSGVKKHDLFPRLEIVRQSKHDGARYFGPYPSASQLRTTVHLINKHFQLRTCPDNVIDNRTRPCIQYQIGRCLAPCVYDVPGYHDELHNVTLFLTGQTKEIAKRLTHKMWLLSQQENYEAAALVRDQIEAVQVSLTSQAVSNAQRRINQDVIATYRKGSYLEIVKLIIRKGQTIGSSHYPFDEQTFPTPELLTSFLYQLYAPLEPEHIPHELLLADDIGEDKTALAETLSTQKGSQVKVLVPTKGKTRALVNIALKNAQLALEERMRTKQANQDSVIALQRFLGLGVAPKVIECFDISLFQGTDAVASQVCFVNGEPDKSRYRNRNIKTVEGTDDFAMLYEAIYRRLKRGLTDDDLPNLLLVDGGKGQLGVALAACKDLGIPVSKEGLYVAGIAKARIIKDTLQSESIQHSSERLFIPGVKDPLLLLPHTAERYLVERIRDEAHRFAITAHRAKRSKRTLTSELDTLKGIGPKRKKQLLTHFGSPAKVLHASLEELQQVPGFSASLAQTIIDQLKR